MPVTRSAALRAFDNGERQPANAKPLSKLARIYLRARERKEKLEKELGQARDALDRSEEGLIDGLEAAGMRSVRLSDGTLLSIASSDLYTLPPKSDASYGDVIAWLRRVRGGPKPELSIHPSTFRAFMLERAAQGRPIHEAVRHLSRKVIQKRGSK